jgi:hypothetical protein
MVYRPAYIGLFQNADVRQLSLYFHSLPIKLKLKLQRQK